MIVGYGSMWPATRFVVQIMPPLWFAVMRLGTAAVLLALVLALMGRFRIPPRSDWAVVFSVGFLMLGGYSLLFHLAMQFVEAGRGSVIGYTTAIFVAPAAAVLYHEPLRRLRLAGLISSVIGLAILFNPAGFDWSDRDVVIGNGMLLLAAMLWSVAILHLRGHRQRTPTIELVPWQIAIGAIVCFIGALAMGTEATVPARLDFALVYGFTIVATVAGAWGVTLTFQHLPVIVSSVGTLGAPVLALVVSVSFMGEPLTWTLALGVALILGGIALVSAFPARA